MTRVPAKYKGLTKRNRDRGVLERTRMQVEIMEKYPYEMIEELKDRLCSTCQRHSCILLPLTTDGKECPYYLREEGIE